MGECVHSQGSFEMPLDNMIIEEDDYDLETRQKFNVAVER